MKPRRAKGTAAIGQALVAASKLDGSGEQKAKANDKAYNVVLKNLPGKLYDPWHGVVDAGQSERDRQGRAARQAGPYAQFRSSPTTQKLTPKSMPIMPVSSPIE